jgi:hypothetical protein
MDKNTPTAKIDAYTTALSRFGYFTTDMLEDGLLDGVYGDEGGLKYPPNNQGKWSAQEEILRSSWVPFLAGPSVTGGWAGGGPSGMTDRNLALAYADERNLSHLEWDNTSGFLTYLGANTSARDALKRRVGSYFQLTNLRLTATFTQIFIQLTVTNDGFAGPHYPHPLDLVLIPVAPGNRVEIRLSPNIRDDADDTKNFPRAGVTKTITYTIPKPPGIQGRYRVYLYLPDNDPLLSAADYALAFMSVGMGITNEGLNDPALTIDFSAIISPNPIPGAPTLSASNNGQTKQVNLSISNIPSSAVTWEYRFKVGAGSYQAPVSNSVTATSTGLSSSLWDFGDTVTFQVRSKNANGDAGAWGLEVPVPITRLAPLAPQSFFATWNESANRMDASYSPRGNTDSLKYRYNVNGGAWTTYTALVLGTTFQVANPGGWVNGDVINFELVAVNAAGDSPPVADSDTVVIGGTQPPSNLSLSLATYNQATSILSLTFASFPTDRDRIRVDVQDGTQWLAAEIVSSSLNVDIPNPGTWVNGDSIRISYRAENLAGAHPPTAWQERIFPIVISTGGGTTNPYLGTYRAVDSLEYPVSPSSTVNPGMSQSTFIATINAVPSGGSVGFEAGIYPYPIPAKALTFYALAKPNIVDNKDAMPVVIRPVNADGCVPISGARFMGLSFDGLNAGDTGRCFNFSSINNLWFQDCLFYRWKGGCFAGASQDLRFYNCISVLMGHATVITNAACFRVINSQRITFKYCVAGHGRKEGFNTFGSSAVVFEECVAYRAGFEGTTFRGPGVGFTSYQATMSKVRIAYCGQRAAGFSFGIDADSIGSGNAALRNAARTQASRVSIYNPTPYGVAMFFEQGGNHSLTDSLVHEAKLNGARITNEAGTLYGVASGVFGSVSDFASNVFPSIKTLNDLNWLRSVAPPYLGKGG